MSELAPGSVSLEDDNPTLESLHAPPAPDPSPAPTQTAPEAPPPAADQDPDGTIEGSGGVKFVPLNAVVDLRGKVRAEKEAREKVEAELAAAKDKAAKYDQVAQDWNRVQPLIHQLQNGQIQPQQPQPTKPAGPLSKEQAELLAKDLDLYATDGSGKLDVDRAQRIAQLTQAIANTSAQQAVQPLYQTSAQQQSQQNFQTALHFKDKNGVQVDKATLERVWGMMPPEMSARSEIAGVLYKVAIAEMVQGGGYKQPVQAPPPPLVTESLGGAPPRAELSQAERNFASAVNMKTSEYEKISAQYKPGERNSLE